MGLIVVTLWVGIITGDVQAAGVSTGVSPLRPPPAVRTLIGGITSETVHVA